MIKYYRNGKGRLIRHNTDWQSHEDTIRFNPDFVEITPTQEEIDELLAKQAKDEVAAQRQREYLDMPVEDQLDEMWKAIEALMNGDQVPQKAIEIILKRKQIKANNPY